MSQVTEKKTSPTILIVDDDPAIIVSTSKALKGLGQIIFAVNGKSALSLAQEKLPDVILLDAEMPEMNGFEVCKELKLNKDTADIPVIFITSRTEDGFEEQVFNQGASDYISKPLNPHVVVARTSLQINYRRALKRLEYLSITDGLTGLHNRRSFDEKFALEFKRAKRTHIPIALLMLDIDQFKQYNDQFGHIVGDTCIQKIAELLQDSTQRPSDFVTRYGGEEFTIVLPDTDLKGAAHFAQSLLKRVTDAKIPHAPNAQRELVTVSIGYNAISPPFEVAPEWLLESADAALFKAKQSGRACAIEATDADAN